MSRSKKTLTEAEARAELSRRNHPQEPEETGHWMDSLGHSRAVLGGIGWPFLPPAYPMPGYGYYAKRGKNPYGGDRGSS